MDQNSKVLPNLPSKLDFFNNIPELEILLSIYSGFFLLKLFLLLNYEVYLRPCQKYGGGDP